MPAREPPPPSTRCISWLQWAQRALLVIGAGALTWSALFVADARLAQREARRTLELASAASPRDSRSEVPRPVSIPDEPEAAIDEPGAAIVAGPGTAIAELSIPRVQLTAAVLQGSDARTLRRGPGHLEDTAMPGTPGNVVIAGHRDTFFSPLRRIRMGDDIFLDTPVARIHYRVTSLDVVEPHDVSVLAQTQTETLTLITCYPFWVLGHAPDRFIVRATRVEGAEAAASLMAVALEPGMMLARKQEEAGSVRQPATVAPTSRTAAPDDETLTREAIERFRQTYNARLVSHVDPRPGGLLTFQPCAIVVIADEATAACPTSTSSPDSTDARVWIIWLRRVSGEWRIGSVQAPDGS